MVGLDNPLHIAMILVVLLLVFGAKRLPDMGKSMGAGLRGFKDSLSGDTPAEHLTAAVQPPTEAPAADLPTVSAPVERTPAAPVA